MSTLKRFGIADGTGGQQMPFARAVQTPDGWLHVSGQIPMFNGDVMPGGITAQSHQAIQNVMAILKEAGIANIDPIGVCTELEAKRIQVNV